MLAGVAACFFIAVAGAVAPGDDATGVFALGFAAPDYAFFLSLVFCLLESRNFKRSSNTNMKSLLSY